MFERTRMKSVNDVVIGSVSEKKKERAVSPLLWKDVSLFDEESLVPRDLFQAKVRFLLGKKKTKSFTYTYEKNRFKRLLRHVCGRPRDRSNLLGLETKESLRKRRILDSHSLDSFLNPREDGVLIYKRC